MFSVTSPTQILNSIVNDSPTKYQYSFQKSQRFADAKPTCPNLFYDGPKFKTRAAGIGYGSRADIASLPSNKFPEPKQYEIKSIFEINKMKNKGKSFGLSRDQTQDKGYISLEPLKVPGPGTYSAVPSASNQKYSIGPRTERDFLPSFLYSKDPHKMQPGPGNYNQITTFNPKGKIADSRFRNERIPVINQREARFRTDLSISPGPGGYKTVNELNPNSKYIDSKIKGSGKRFIGHEIRKTFIDQILNKSVREPGPGLYRLKSDFGHYDHLDQDKAQKK